VLKLPMPTGQAALWIVLKLPTATGEATRWAMLKLLVATGELPLGSAQAAHGNW